MNMKKFHTSEKQKVWHERPFGHLTSLSERKTGFFILILANQKNLLVLLTSKKSGMSVPSGI